MMLSENQGPCLLQTMTKAVKQNRNVMETWKFSITYKVAVFDVFSLMH